MSSELRGSYFSSDTIAAIATSMAGDAGIGVIRLSGPQALKTAQLVCRGLSRPKPRYLHRVEIFDVAGSSVIDDGLAVYFQDKASFTGEDVVELQLHGGRFVLQTVLNRLISTGLCRMALPGEFSFRAVRNQKLALTQASAVGQVISAKSKYELETARKALSKARVIAFDTLTEKLRDLLARTELSIDFIDQDVEVISAEDLVADLTQLEKQILALLETMKLSMRVSQGLSVTLFGSPNAGKSTLFNALIGEDRAIVSQHAGTTRDVITEEINLKQYRIRLADTAGVRNATGSIEREGISKARDLATSSDLVLLVLDATQTQKDIEENLDWAKAVGIIHNCIVVLNKADQITSATEAQILDAVQKQGEGARCLSVSAKSTQGIMTLLTAIAEVLDKKINLGSESWLPTEFQLQMLDICRDEVSRVKTLVEATGTQSPELVSAGLFAAVRALTDVVGETTPDTVLTKIFSEFCIGK